MMRPVLACALLSALAVPAAAQIVPEDGVWAPADRELELAEACPPAAQGMAQMMAEGFDRNEAKTIEWGGSFDPNRLTAENPGQEMDWERVDENSWRAVVPEAPEGAFDMVLTALSEDRVQGLMTMDMGAMMSGGGGPDMTGCVVSVRMFVERQC